MPKPIFVVGKHRSGTTWLANQLCQHTAVAGATHTRHFGVAESGYFQYLDGRYGDLANRSNYLEFIEVISSSDYFRIIGSSKEFLQSLWPTTYENVFRQVMDSYAERQGAAYWLEKSPSHSLFMKRLADFYPDARFISIMRNPEAVVASTLTLANLDSQNARLRRRAIISTVLSWTLYNKNIRSFSNHNNKVLMLDYQVMRANLVDVLQRVCLYLDIPYEEAISRQVFLPNTSFRDGGRENALSDGERILVRFVQKWSHLLPIWTLNSAHSWRESKKRQSLPPWFFSMQLHDDTVQSSSKRGKPIGISQ